MAVFKIAGKQELKGTIPISGAKNAALKLLPAAILADSPSTIFNVPNISDIKRMVEILKSIGAEIEVSGATVTVDPTGINSQTPSPDLINKLRGSIVLVGPLLAKYGRATFSQPGGCLIGARPIDDHLDVFEQLGVKIHYSNGQYHLKGKPKAAEITLNKMSVTATENAIMAAVLSPGTTKIHVAAAEPEIVNLASFLNKMGANVKGAGTHDIIIEGTSSLKGTNETVIPDRIEAGTFIIAAIAANANLTIGPIISSHLSIVLKKLAATGAKFKIINKNNLEFIATEKHGELRAVDIDTRTFPGFPTDLQSPYVALMTQAKGKSRVFETIFEGRFLFAAELQKMGAKIEILSPHLIDIHGPINLKPKKIFCQDIRGGVALVIAALVADGETKICDIEYIDRGYENIDEKLRQVGAKIERIN